MDCQLWQALVGIAGKSSLGPPLRNAAMNSRKPPVETRHRVWRISEAAPLGEWVDKAAAAHRPPAADAPEVTFGSWFSSYDLLDGASVSEAGDTVPSDLFDELFKPASGAEK